MPGEIMPMSEVPKNKEDELIGDRFLELSNNYGELFTEVFQVQGLDYQKFQASAVEAVRSVLPNMKDSSILEIGVGDGETAQLFIDAGCAYITGLDLNREMLNASKKRFGDRMPLVQGDATHIDRFFKHGSFDVIVSASCIHNIPKERRGDLFRSLISMNPHVVVLAEKIVEVDEERHQALYASEVVAIEKVFGERHKLPLICEEWLRHYEDDELERLEFSEIEMHLGKKYDLQIVFEMGMYKTVLCTRKGV